MTETTATRYADLGRVSDLVGRTRRRAEAVLARCPDEPTDESDLVYGSNPWGGEQFIDRYSDSRRVGLVTSAVSAGRGAEPVRVYAVIRPHGELVFEAVAWKDSPRRTLLYHDGHPLGAIEAAEEHLHITANRWKLTRADGSVFGEIRTGSVVSAREPLLLVRSDGNTLPVYVASPGDIRVILRSMFYFLTLRWWRLTRPAAENERLIPETVAAATNPADRALYLAASAVLRVVIANFD